MIQAQSNPQRGGSESSSTLNLSGDGTKVLTPQMRLHFYFNAKRLRPSEMLELQRIVRQKCPAALSDLQTGDIKIDIDALNFSTFIRLDVHVRNLLVQRT